MPDNVEYVERYNEGGYHPVHLEDTFRGRYHIAHKFGWGGSSTVWLARDEQTQRLVSLKFLTAQASKEDKELRMLRYLDRMPGTAPGSGSIISIIDMFKVEGPNGTHTCYVSHLGGLSIGQLIQIAWQVAGSRQLRGSLARRLARQLAEATSYLHSVGMVHGDITPRNVLLRLTGVDSWSLDEIYRQFGHPRQEKVFSATGEEPGIHAPKYLVQPTSFFKVESKYFSQDILLIDLGEAFLSSSPPLKGVGTPNEYASPETMLEKQASKWSDIWTLSCTIFEMRSGFPLFESWLGYDSYVLEEMLRILGKPPESLCAAFEQRCVPVKEREESGQYSLVDQVSEIGTEDEPPLRGEAPTRPWMESTGTRPSSEEVRCLAGLLQRTLSYIPEERLPIERILKHRWFTEDF